MFKKTAKEPAGINPIASAIHSSAKALAIKGTEKAGEAIVLALVGAVMPSAIGGVVASVSAEAVSKLVESLIKESDGSRRLLEALTLEPFQTGTRMVQSALALPATSTDLRAFRDGRLTSGVVKLEEAFSLARDVESKMVILLLMGLAEVVTPGGRFSARQRFEELAMLASEQIDAERRVIEAMPGAQKASEGAWKEREQRFAQAVRDGEFSSELVRRPPSAPAVYRDAAERAHAEFLERSKQNRQSVEQLDAVRRLALEFAHRTTSPG